MAQEKEEFQGRDSQESKFDSAERVIDQLDPQKLQEILQKQWAAKERQFKNLSGPKTPEGKRKALSNLTTPKKVKLTKKEQDEGYIKQVLSQEAQEFYQQRRQKYLEDFELNDSSDYIALDEIIWLEIKILHKIEQISRAKKFDPEHLKELERMNNLYRQLLNDLGMTRTQRLKQREQVTESIADLIVQFDKERWRQKLAEYEQEEREEMRRKKERDDTVDMNDLRSIEEYVEGIGNGDSEETAE